MKTLFQIHQEVKALGFNLKEVDQEWDWSDTYSMVKEYYYVKDDIGLTIYLRKTFHQGKYLTSIKVKLYMIKIKFYLEFELNKENITESIQVLNDFSM